MPRCVIRRALGSDRHARSFSSGRGASAARIERICSETDSKPQWCQHGEYRRGAPSQSMTLSGIRVHRRMRSALASSGGSRISSRDGPADRVAGIRREEGPFCRRLPARSPSSEQSCHDFLNISKLSQALNWRSRKPFRATRHRPSQCDQITDSKATLKTKCDASLQCQLSWTQSSVQALDDQITLPLFPRRSVLTVGRDH
jgi:hypothetical protein